MIKFNKNKLQTFKCKVNVTGAGDNPKITPRLILLPKGSKAKVFFEGKYDDGKCIIEIETGLDFAKKGDLVLEILANSTVFQPWKDTFEIVSEQVVVEGIELIDSDMEIIVEVTDTPKKTPKTKVVNHNLFKSKVPKKTQQKIVTEYIDRTKNIKNKKNRKELLTHIITKYKPKKRVLEWGSQVFVSTHNPKAKVAMYMAELEQSKIDKRKIAEGKSEIDKKYPEVEEWSSDRQGMWMNWKVVAKKDWGPRDARKFQTTAGYDPNGYHFANFNKSKNIDDTFTFTWKCYSSSD